MKLQALRFKTFVILTLVITSTAIKVNYSKSVCHDIQKKQIERPPVEHILQVTFCNISRKNKQLQEAGQQLRSKDFEPNEINHIFAESTGLSRMPDGFFCYFPYVVEAHLFDNCVEDIQHLGLLSPNQNTSTLDDSAGCGHSLTMLDLPYNCMRVLRNNSFPQSLKNLRLLNLMNNSLRTIESAAFATLVNLRQLYLGFNELTTLHSFTFHSNRGLKILHLSYNKLENITLHGRFHKLTLFLGNNSFDRFDRDSLPIDVRQLDLSENAFTQVPKNALQSMPNLVTLDMDSNEIEKLDENTFKNINKLKSLRINHNRINSIHHSTFKHLNQLLHLHLTHNELERLPLNVFDNLHLHQLNLSYNNLSHFHQRLGMVNIDTLDLSFNNVDTVVITSDGNAAATANQSVIRSLQLSRNKISSLSPSKINLTSIIENLEEIDLQSNEITNIDPCFFQKAKILSYLNLDDNKLTTTPFFPDLGRPFELSLRDNQLICNCYVGLLLISNIYLPSRAILVNADNITCTRIFNGHHREATLRLADEYNSFDFLCPFNMSQADHECLKPIANNRVEFVNEFSQPCPKACSCYRDGEWVSTFIDCNHGNLTDIPKDFVLPIHTLILSNNKIRNIKNGKLYKNTFKNLVKLSFDHNLLGLIEQNALSKVTLLEELFLQHNRLKSLPQQLFFKQHKLEILDLSYNHLFAISDKLFQPLTHLKELHLQSNDLVELPVWNLPTNVKILELHNNSWSCDCNYAENFSKWMTQYDGKILEKSHLHCFTDDSPPQKIFFSRYNYSRCAVPNILMETVLSEKTTLLTISLAILIVVVFVSTLVFIYRREMQVIIYSRYGVRLFYRSEDDGDENKFFDAFLSYSGLDEEIVVRDILPGFEQIPNPYRLCLHHRDFLPGGYVSESIIEAIESSRRTILVVSENFVQSVWCRDEFRLAHALMLEERRCRMIVILLNGIPQTPFPELKHYLRTHTYLSWHEQLFWQKLYFAMPNQKTQQTNQAEIGV